MVLPFEDVKIPTGTAQIRGDLCRPLGTASTPLVVLVYGTEGYEDTPHGPWKTMIQGYARELAAQGVAALIPNYFAKTGTGYGGVAGGEIIRFRDDWAAALVDTVVYARTLPRIDASRIGLLGFSLGGHLCLRIRGAAKPKALVEYFAPVFDGIGPTGAVPRVQIHHGTLDVGPTAFANAALIEGALKLEGTDVTVFPYKDATHGFAGKDPANTGAAALSKSRTVAFFSTSL